MALIQLDGFGGFLHNKVQPKNIIIQNHLVQVPVQQKQEGLVAYISVSFKSVFILLIVDRQDDI